MLLWGRQSRRPLQRSDGQYAHTRADVGIRPYARSSTVLFYNEPPTPRKKFRPSDANRRVPHLLCRTMVKKE